MLCCPLQGVLLVALLLSLSQADLKECVFIACFFYSGIFAKRETSLCLGGEKEENVLLALSFLLLSSSLTS